MYILVFALLSVVFCFYVKLSVQRERLLSIFKKMCEKIGYSDYRVESHLNPCMALRLLTQPQQPSFQDDVWSNLLRYRPGAA
jgi:hypothetical protein